MNTTANQVRGRFAPSPTGRMHLGNVWAALISCLSVKSRGGVWILRHEDLDRQRSHGEYARLIEDDLHWLGLEWDEGGLDSKGGYGPYMQSKRSDIYIEVFDGLARTGLLYCCGCRRADLLASSAPHASDGRVIYAGTCRPDVMPQRLPVNLSAGKAVRVGVDDTLVEVDDMFFGPHRYKLDSECGDFIVRRADGAFAYQLAVVADDAAMHVTEVVRGCDLLPSAAQQMYLYGLLHKTPPRFGHLPLLCNAAGQRLSKRDAALSMEYMRARFAPEQIIGYLAWLGGMRKHLSPCSVEELVKNNAMALFRAGSKEIMVAADLTELFR